MKELVCVVRQWFLNLVQPKSWSGEMSQPSVKHSQNLFFVLRERRNRRALSNKETTRPKTGVPLSPCAAGEVDEEAKKIREERLSAYATKKSKKPGPIAKSSIVLDVKPWDDETDMKKMEESVRTIAKDGLLWGASKLVPVGYGILKLQISCVVEDENYFASPMESQPKY